MTSKADVVGFELRQTLSLSSDSPVWSEQYQARVYLTSDALSSGWIRENFSGKAKSDLIVLFAIAMHARPLDGSDLAFLVSIQMATPEDRLRLYARVTDLGIADELGMDRETIHAAARRLADKGFLTIVEIPKDKLQGGRFRDSKGKFEGSKVFLLAGDIFSGFQKTMTQRNDPKNPPSVHAGSTCKDTKASDCHVGLTGNDAEDPATHAELSHLDRANSRIHAQLSSMERSQNVPENGQPMPDCPVSRVGSSGTNESLNSVKDESVVDLITTTDSSDSDSAGEKQIMLQKLVDAGIWKEVAAELVEGFALEHIQRWLSLLPDALATGVARQPGWLVAALRRNYSIERTVSQIKDAQARRSPQIEWPEPVDPKTLLPQDLISDLEELGWAGSYEVIADVWARDEALVNAWYDYVWEHFETLKSPVGVFRSGICSGEYPPRKPRKKRSEMSYQEKFETDPYRSYYK